MTSSGSPNIVASLLTQATKSSTRTAIAWFPSDPVR